MALNVVLVEPEIPQNAGNIIRTCANTGAKLHLVRPLGFFLSDKYLKRSGLDYFDIADISYYNCFEELNERFKGSQFFYSTTRGENRYTEVNYNDGCFLVFGKETGGLPLDLIEKNLENTIRIPMIDNESARCLNLSNSVAIVIYEALRQLKFFDMI